MARISQVRTHPGISALLLRLPNHHNSVLGHYRTGCRTLQETLIVTWFPKPLPLVSSVLAATLRSPKGRDSSRDFWRLSVHHVLTHAECL